VHSACEICRNGAALLTFRHKPICSQLYCMLSILHQRLYSLTASVRVDGRCFPSVVAAWRAETVVQSGIVSHETVKKKYVILWLVGTFGWCLVRWWHTIWVGCGAMHCSMTSLILVKSDTWEYERLLVASRSSCCDNERCVGGREGSWLDHITCAK